MKQSINESAQAVAEAGRWASGLEAVAERISYTSPRIIQVSNITPGITRRAGPLKEFDKHRVRGRVHAVVGGALLLQL